MMKKKRKYTMSDRALKARRRNAKKALGKQTGPKTSEGKEASSRNAWQHGLRSSSNKAATALCSSIGRPCLSTCTKYPCDIVEDGESSLGEDCLDGKFMTTAYRSLIKAMKEGKCDDLYEIVALQMASNLQLVQWLKDEFFNKGPLLKVDRLDKNGNIIGNDYKLNPVLFALPKLIADLGLTLPEALLTPRAKAKVETEEEGVRTIADLMGLVGRKRKDLEKVEAKRIGDSD